MKTEWRTSFKCFLNLPSVLSFTPIQTFYTAQTFSIHVEVFASLTPKTDNEERKCENKDGWTVSDADKGSHRKLTSDYVHLPTYQVL